MTTISTTPTSVLVVDDELIVRESLGGWFRDDGCDVGTAESGRQALQRCEEREFDIALIDIKMPGMDGLELQRRLAEVAPNTSVIVMTAYASVDTAVSALKAGAYDYIVKPFDPDELSQLVRRAAAHRRRNDTLTAAPTARVSNPPLARLIGASPAMRRVLDVIQSVAPTDATVLVTGESGTGKELVAAAIHAASPRHLEPMVAVHCGALAEGVLESELFGHEQGAFTGAGHRHKGKFEQAAGGTIFLDEIGDISPKVQIELLRVLEEKRVTRVGGKASIAVDFRVIAATNRDLRRRVEQGLFREDLYYRLNVVSVEIPPLRERASDLPALARHLLERCCAEMRRPPMRFSAEALAALQRHTWPGNVRELQNAVERAVVLGTPPEIVPSDLPHYVNEAAVRPQPRSLAELERSHIARVLDETGWNMSQSARVLGIDRGTLYAKVRRLGMERPPNGA
jgi:DNA-binding NtrC family response regulator